VPSSTSSSFQRPSAATRARSTASAFAVVFPGWKSSSVMIPKPPFARRMCSAVAAGPVRLMPGGRRSNVRASSLASRPLSAVAACCSAAVAAALSQGGAFAAALAQAASAATSAADRQSADRHYVVIPVGPRDRLGECGSCPRPPSYALKRT
jgi:hypothetical protein